MNNHEAVITLSIKEANADGQPVFLFHVQLDGEVIINNKSLSMDESQSARDMSRQHNAMFERDDDPVIISNELKVLGAELFKLWLGEAWPQISQRLKPGARRTLVIASDLADILNLPWELMRPAGDNFAGLDPKFTIRRVPSNDKPIAEFDSALRPRPVRILFMACAPREVAQLDFEREEEAIFKVLAKAGSNIAFHSGDAGSFDELRDLINEFDPHIVHLTGHGIVKKDGLGYFYFEDERGAADPRSSVEMREELFGGSNVQLAFISGCQTGKAPPVAAIGGICQGLVSEEIPLAIGWAASIADDIATDFAAAFYKTLAAGQTVDRALTQARQAIKDTCDERGYPGWTLPVLYCTTTQSLLFDRKSQPDPPPRASVVQRPLEGMTEGYTDHFVGRRREIQRLLPAMREGAIQTLILTGIGGAGKSTLATRLARKLESDEWKPIPISSTKDVKLSAARLIQSCGDAFLKAGLRDAFDTLNDANIAVDARLRFIVSTLNDHPFLLVLDNFEENLDEQTRSIIDEQVREFYKHLLSHLVGRSRAIITCRYLPSDARLPNIAHEEALGDFPESSFMKFLMRDPVLERRYYDGKLPRELLRELHRLFGGTPRFIAQIREAIKTMTASELRGELEKVKLPAGVEKGVLEKERDRYCEDIFTARLYGYLSEESRRALSRAAVYNVSVNAEGIAAAAGIAVDAARGFLREWQNYALACRDIELGIDDLWSVYGLLRGWLLSPERLSEEERIAAHHAAGDFLREIFKQKRVGELGLSWIECLTEARAQYIEAGDYALAREATNRISGFLTRQGLYEDLAEINREMLDCEEHPAPMMWIGRVHLERGDYPEAREWYERSLITAGEDLLKESASAWHGLATIDLNVGDYDSARENFQKSLEIKQQIGDPDGEAVIWHGLASIDLNVGDYAAARENFQKALTMRQHIGDRDGEAATLHQLATIDVNMGDYDAAREKLQKALILRQQTGSRTGEAAIWHQLATIDFQIGDYEAAREKFQESLEIFQQIGDRVSEASAWHNLATIDLEAGDYNATREKYQKALEIFQEIGNRANEAATWHGLATIDLLEDDYNAARKKFQEALSMSQQLGDRAGEASTFFQLGIMAARSERVAGGVQLVALSFLIDQSIGHNEAKIGLNTLLEMAAHLSYTQEQIEAMLGEVMEAHKADRGWGLIEAAFPKS